MGSLYKVVKLARHLSLGTSHSFCRRVEWELHHGNTPDIYCLQYLLHQSGTGLPPGDCVEESASRASNRTSTRVGMGRTSGEGIWIQSKKWTHFGPVHKKWTPW